MEVKRKRTDSADSALQQVAVLVHEISFLRNRKNSKYHSMDKKVTGGDLVLLFEEVLAETLEVRIGSIESRQVEISIVAIGHLTTKEHQYKEYISIYTSTKSMYVY